MDIQKTLDNGDEVSPEEFKKMPAQEQGIVLVLDMYHKMLKVLFKSRVFSEKEREVFLRFLLEDLENFYAAQKGKVEESSKFKH